MNLEPFVNTFNVLNYDKTFSTVNHIYEILSHNATETGSYIVSNCDQEMLLLIQFNEEIVLETITFHAFNDNNIIKTKSSQPKFISIYKMNNISLNFNDISSAKPDKSINCNAQKLNDGHTVKLRNDLQNAIKFNKVRHLVIYIQSNQNDTRRTFLNGITMKGTVKEQNIHADAFDPVGFWKREMKNKNYASDLSESRVCQRHLDVIKSKYFPVINYAAMKIDNTSMVPLTTNDSLQSGNNLTFTKISSKTDRGAHILNLYVKSGVVQKILYDYKYKNRNTLIEVIEQKTNNTRMCSSYFTQGSCERQRITINGCVASTTRINLYTIAYRSDMDILSTLIHELAHMGASDGHGIEFIEQQSKIGHFMYENMRKKTVFYKSGNQIITSRTNRKNVQMKKRSIYTMMNSNTVSQSKPKRRRVGGFTHHNNLTTQHHRLDDERMFNQLRTFGYQQSDILLAMNSVKDKNNMDQIMDALQQQQSLHHVSQGNIDSNKTKKTQTVKSKKNIKCRNKEMNTNRSRIYSQQHNNNSNFSVPSPYPKATKGRPGEFHRRPTRNTSEYVNNLFYNNVRNREQIRSPPTTFKISPTTSKQVPQKPPSPEPVRRLRSTADVPSSSVRLSALNTKTIQSSYKYTYGSQQPNDKQPYLKYKKKRYCARTGNNLFYNNLRNREQIRSPPTTFKISTTTTKQVPQEPPSREPVRRLRPTADVPSSSVRLSALNTKTIQSSYKYTYGSQQPNDKQPYLKYKKKRNCAQTGNPSQRSHSSIITIPKIAPNNKHGTNSLPARHYQMTSHLIDPEQSQITQNNESGLHNTSNSGGYFDVLIAIILILILYCFIMSSIIVTPTFSNVLDVMQFVKEYGIYASILLLRVRMLIN